jgi:hypothetical protein
VIEGQDINDGDILSKSTQEQHPNGKGAFRFKYKLPNGHELVSEWITRDHARKAMPLWCDAVRNGLVGYAEEKAAAKRANAKKAEPHPLDEKGLPPSRDMDRDCKPPALTSEADPVHHAKNQVALLEAEERHWLAESERATKHLTTTRDKLRKWKQIVASFEAGEK